MNHIIRLATPADSEAILSIYAPYVRDTAISFETEVPTVDAFSRRIETICKQYPYLVYSIDGQIIGFAYASRHRERAAYCYSVDVSIYVLPRYHGANVAHQLYRCLFDILRALGYRNAYAGYRIPNDKSMRFHQKFGFVPVGTYHNVGYKLGKWHDMTWLEKMIAAHDEQPGPLLSVTALPEEYLKHVLTVNEERSGF